jgi:outer membrane protein assembly factor BamB
MFSFELIDAPGVEIDSLCAYRLPGDEDTSFHAAYATAARDLVSISIEMADDQHLLNLAWNRQMQSRAWHVIHVPESTASGDPFLFTAREDGHFHAYAQDGTPCWSHEFSATISSFIAYADPVTGLSTLLVPSIDKTLRMLDAGSGRLLWGDTFHSGVNCVAETILDEDGSHVIAAGGNDYTARFYRRAGDEQAYPMAWYYKCDSYVRDVSISKHGLVAVVADDGFLTILDTSDGAALWSHEFDSFAWKCRIVDDASIVLSSSYQVPVKVDEGGELLGNPGVIACHDLHDGDLRWISAPEDGLNINDWCIFESAGKWLVAAGTSSGKIVVLDAIDGMVLDSHECGYLINSIDVIALGNERLALVACQEDEKQSLVIGIQN